MPGRHREPQRNYWDVPNSDNQRPQENNEMFDAAARQSDEHSTFEDDYAMAESASEQGEQADHQASHHRREQAKSRRPWLADPSFVRWAALTVCALVLGASLGWIAFRPGTVVARGVTYQGKSLSGMTEQQVSALVGSQKEGLAKAKIQIHVEGQPDTTTDAASTGLEIDQAETVRKVMSAHRGIGGKLAAVFTTSRLQPVVRLDEEKVADLADELFPDEQDAKEADPKRKQPSNTTPIEVNQFSEARIDIDERTNKLVGVAGRAGPGVLADKLRDQLLDVTEKSLDPAAGLSLRFKPEQLTPRFSKEDADRLAAEAENLIQNPLPIKAGETNGELGTDALRPLIYSRPGAKSLQLVVNADKAQDAAAKAMQSAGTGATEAAFAVVNNAPRFVPGKPGTKCCADGSGTRVGDAILRRPSGQVVLDLAVVNPKFDEAAAAKLGIKEKIAEFTTTHDPPKGRDRVHNIHLIADMVKGQVILPGQTFSVNKFVGPRTTEKGFVKDHSIEDGRIIDTVGGGVSQFATTLFNAAWEAGLDIPVSMPHSIWFKRYPKGRDATLSYPNVDLRIKNPFPEYGVLIWAAYTDRSITISLWSTKYFQKVDAPMFEKGGGTESPYLLACTEVQVKRTVTLPDGTIRTDFNKARYQMKEGVLCNGDQTAVKDENGVIIKEAKPYVPGDPLPPGITTPKSTQTTNAKTTPTAGQTTTTTSKGAPTTPATKPKRT